MPGWLPHHLAGQVLLVAVASSVEGRLEECWQNWPRNGAWHWQARSPWGVCTQVALLKQAFAHVLTLNGIPDF
jgi:hypothetical protein